KWAAVTSFPSVIHQELLARDLIPNYHIGQNERQIQWVGQCDWEYRAQFVTPKKLLSNTDLVFEGLDTFATITLNGNQILRSENMFVPARVNAKDYLRDPGEENEIVITFESAVKVGSQFEKIYGKRRAWMRDTKRYYERKAQYSWGWDWGPIVLTAGPWKPAYLDTYDTKIEDVYFRTLSLAPNHTNADIGIDVNISSANTNLQALVTLTDAKGKEAANISIPLNGTDAGSIEWRIKSPKLWWPNGQGQAHLYNASIKLVSSEGTILDTKSLKFGVRTTEVIQQPLNGEPGTTFMFRVNGRDIFAQGGNWIPADNLLPTITRKRYFDWIKLGAYSHLNMIRVWGGGIYETDDFFDACDAHGILVWQDFGFACGDYPTNSDFLSAVREEASSVVLQLRNRASLALFAGDNEDFMLTDLITKYDHSDTTGPFLDTNFPQREIFLKILPEECTRLAPTTQYWPSSPWGGSTANDPTVGDIHQWSVWHGPQLPYQSYPQLAGRFVSEFGMHGFPVERTVDYFTRGAPATELHPQSRTIDCHNKGEGAHTRIARYLAENFRFDMQSLSNFTYASQLMQSEAYGYALRGWKRLFGGPGKEKCAGAIIWQLNDVYPCTSWAYVDYFLRPKPAFYTIRRAFAPVSVGVMREPASRWIDEDHPLESYIPSFETFAHNTTASEKELELRIAAFDFSNGEWTELGDHRKRKVTLQAGQNTELGRLERQDAWGEESLVILEVELVDQDNGEVVARHVDWPEPYRYLNWPKGTSVSVAVSEAEKDGWENTVSIKSAQPFKGVWLEPVYDGTEKDDDTEPLWEDNMLDLMPGQELSVRVNGLRGRKVKARFMYD
ncbi:glycoside hydrolase, partial [Corynespora cassiicola Philippines]